MNASETTRAVRVDTAVILPKLLARIRKTAGCWEWVGFVNREGYGAFGVRSDGRTATMLAHRLVYSVLVGPISDGLTLDHLCHNADTSCPCGFDCRHRRCVNPAHLEPVPFEVNVLRGGGPGAVNGRKNECDSGHPFDEANTYIRPAAGGRDCRACGRDRQRECRRRKREQEIRKAAAR